MCHNVVFLGCLDCDYVNLKTALPIVGLATLTALVLAVPALAFDELADDHPLSGTRDCFQCHSIVGTETSQTVDPASREAPHLRKGPHGGYNTTTSKCSTCHTVHNAAAGGTKLLPAATIRATCETCHDGTGGKGVYGVIKARTGFDPSTDPGGSAHRIEIAGNSSIPGGSPGGGVREATFSGPGGTLTCSDCHSPHDGNTVEPFLGDRLRASLTSDTAYPTAETNKLLKTQPTSGDRTVAVYGGAWCASCHQGHDPINAVNHPVHLADTYYYNNVARYVDNAGTPGYELGRLGQSNAGYVLPDWPVGYEPICQQCHEDVRRVGRITPRVLDASEAFTVTAPDGTVVTDNPRFQTFPHESEAPAFLIVDTGVDGMDALCLNCHEMGG